jgi:hypothetical protein
LLITSQGTCHKRQEKKKQKIKYEEVEIANKKIKRNKKIIKSNKEMDQKHWRTREIYIEK